VRPLLSGEVFARPAGDSSFAVLHGLYWLVVNLAASRPLLIAAGRLEGIARQVITRVNSLGPSALGLAQALAVLGDG